MWRHRGLLSDMEVSLECSVSSRAADPGEPFTFQPDTTTDGTFRIYTLEPRNFIPSNSWIVVDGSSEHSCVRKLSVGPWINDLREYPGDSDLGSFGWQDRSGAEKYKGVSSASNNSFFVD